MTLSAFPTNAPDPRPPRMMSFENWAGTLMISNGLRVQINNIRNEAVRHCRIRSVNLKDKAGE